jgi:hypothetical protein
MLAPRIRGAFVPVTLALLALASACSNGTEPKKPLCDAANPLSLNAGQVQTPISDACVYVSGGTSGGEFALVPFNADTVYAHIASVAFTSQGVAAVTTPLTSRTFASAPSFSLTPDKDAAAMVGSTSGFELRLRENERRVLTPLIPAARSWYRNRYGSQSGTGLRPSFSTVASPPAVGDLITLNTKTGATLSDACQVPDDRTGRVVAVTSHAIVIADTANPTGGYTDTEYLTVGQQFDDVYAMDIAAFGDPSDIDTNGKIVMFFTRAVNEMTPKGSGSVVGGFFYGRDLFPKTDSPALGPGSGCATSNVSEMFYLAVPDPNALVNGNTTFTKNFISHLTLSTTAHEFQHLINASRRLYVNTAATDFEVVWLNEGLSHIAEELLFYRQSNGLTPRTDVDSLDFKGNQTNVDSYNYNQQSNFGRFREYLLKPSVASPYAPDDSLWTRGATWAFLRYAADHRGTSDGDTWFKLVNSTKTGLPNLQDVFGAGLMSIFRDWSVATIADDLPGVANQWQDPSWNFRSIFTYIPSIKSYPLATVTVGDNAPLNVSLKGGTSAYVRFSIAAGQVGSVQWSTQSNGVAMSLVRLK